MNLRETFRSNDREKDVDFGVFPILADRWGFGFEAFPIYRSWDFGCVVEVLGFSDQIDREWRSSAAARSRERRALIPCQISRVNRCNLLRPRVPCYIGWKNPNRGVYI
jgi:hypothetical protein